MNRRLSTADDANIDIHKVFSDLFHGSARAIIRSLESGLAQAVAIARLNRDGLNTLMLNPSTSLQTYYFSYNILHRIHFVENKDQCRTLANSTEKNSKI